MADGGRGVSRVQGTISAVDTTATPATVTIAPAGGGTANLEGERGPTSGGRLVARAVDRRRAASGVTTFCGSASTETWQVCYGAVVSSTYASVATGPAVPPVLRARTASWYVPSGSCDVSKFICVSSMLSRRRSHLSLPLRRNESV